MFPNPPTARANVPLRDLQALFFIPAILFISNLLVWSLTPTRLLHFYHSSPVNWISSHDNIYPANTNFLYLPIILRTLPRYAGLCSLENNFCEPNNSPEMAYGPLAKSQVYSAFPEDSYDYYYVTLPVKGALKVEIIGYNATGNLLIYRANDTTNPIANWGQGGSSMTLNLSNLDPGNYFILVYTSTGFNSVAAYTLKATY